LKAFTPAELLYLQTQPLMRFASASLNGSPDVAPVVFDDLERIDPWSPKGNKIFGLLSLKMESRKVG
jgi:hypothetical protein